MSKIRTWVSCLFGRGRVQQLAAWDDECLHRYAKASGWKISANLKGDELRRRVAEAERKGLRAR